MRMPILLTLAAALSVAITLLLDLGPTVGGAVGLIIGFSAVTLWPPRRS